MFVRYNHNKSPLSIWFIRQSFSCSTCRCIFTAWGMNCLDSSIIWSLGQTFWKVFKLKFFQIFKLKLILTWLCHNSKYIDSWLNVDTWSTQPFKNNRGFPIFFFLLGRTPHCLFVLTDSRNYKKQLQSPQ